MKNVFCICLLLGLAMVCTAQPSDTNKAAPAPHNDTARAAPSREPSSPEEVIRRALRDQIPKGPRSAAKAYDELFSDASEAKLQALAEHPNLSIALQARWELRDTRPAKPFDPAHPWHFPGFLEGEMGLRVPMRWAVGFAAVWFGNMTDVDRAWEPYRQAGYPGIEKLEFTFETGERRLLNVARFTPKLHRTSYGPLAPPDTEIREEGEELSICAGESTVRVSKAPFDKLFPLHYGPRDYQVAVRIGPSRTWIALHRDSVGAFPLFCIDRASGRMLWHAAVWDNYTEFVSQMTGPTLHDFELTGDGKRITVFGHSSRGGYYIESFDARSGVNLLRFSTRYWNCRKRTA